MIGTSALFSQKIAESSRQFRARLLYEGAAISGEIRNITINKGACGESFSIGSIYSSYIEVTLDECEEILENKELLLQIGLVIDGTVEYIGMGYYTVTKPSRSAYQTTFTAVGRITSKLNCLPTLPANQTLDKLGAAITEATGVQIICKGVTLAGNIEEDLTGLTCRELLEVITAVLGGFATEDNEGNIVISKFSTADQVAFNGERTITDPEFSDYDYELTGVKVITTEEWTDEDGTVHPEVSFTEGMPRQTLSIKYMTESLFSAFKANVVGYTYRPGAIPLALGDPRLDPWDCILYTDAKGNAYVVPCLGIVHTFDGGLSTVITAPGKSETESSSSVAGPIAQQMERLNSLLITAQKAILKRLRADEILTDNITGATGNFTKYLTGVKIIGDLIEAGTLKADRLIIKGSDGKYYKINTNFTAMPEVEPVEEDTIHGSVLVKESITADRINVTDLFAQDIEATGSIKGATIETNSGNIAGWDLTESGLEKTGRATLSTSWGMPFEVDVIGTLYSSAEYFDLTSKEDDNEEPRPTGTSMFCLPLLQFEIRDPEDTFGQSMTTLGTYYDGEFKTLLFNNNGAYLSLGEGAELNGSGTYLLLRNGYAALYANDGITLWGDVNVDGNLSICGVDIADIVGSGSGGGSSEYETVDSVEEMTDTSKQYVLKSTGTLWEYQEQVVGGYTNLFDTSGSGYTAWNGSQMYTNWIPYSSVFKDGSPAVYHFKGWNKDNSPYKYHLAMDGNGANASALTYTWQNNTAIQMLAQSDYDSQVRILQPQNQLSTGWTHIQFEFREDIADNLIITANENIVEATTAGVWVDTGVEPESTGGSGGGNYVDLLIKITQNKNDIAEISNRVAELESDSSEYKTVDSVEEMTDTSQVYVLESTGTIWEYQEQAVGGYTNLFDVNGTGYEAWNGSKMYTNLLPLFTGDTANVYHIKGWDTDNSPYKYQYANRNGTLADNQIYTWQNNSYLQALATSDYDSNVKTFQPVANTTYQYIRFEFREDVADNLIITANENIVEATTTGAWIDTGVKPIAGGSTDLAGLMLDVRKNTQNIGKLEERVSSLEEKEASDGSASDIPDYWKTAVDALGPHMLELQNTYGADAFQLMFGADVHGTSGYTNTNGAGTSNTKNIGTVAEYTTDKYSIPGVLFAGDIHSQSSHANESSVDAEYESLWEHVLGPISIEKLLVGLGNHDGAWGSPVDGVYYLKDIGNKRVYNYLFRKQALDRSRRFGKDGTYFYVDMPPNARVIMLNCQTDGDGSNDANGDAVYNSMKVSVYGTEQLAWLKEALLSAPEGTKIIVSAHQPLANSKDGALVAGMLEAYNSRGSYNNSVTITDDYWGKGVTDTTHTQVSVDVNFADAKGKVMCYVHGHIHKDTISTTYSFPCISITTAGGDVRDSVPQERVVGTATETALDILTITSERIYATRLGAGSGEPNADGIYERVVNL